MNDKTKSRPKRNTVELNHLVSILKQEILDGYYFAGQRLIESELMEHLGIKRGRVREIFKRLEADGLVQIDKNKGASIRKISRTELKYTSEVMDDIGILIIKKLSKRVHEKDVAKKLKESLKIARQFRKKSASTLHVQAYIEENRRFWASLTELTGNPVLADFRLRLEIQLCRFTVQGFMLDAESDKWIAKHEEIITALLEGKASDAIRYAKKSMTDVWEAMMQLPDGAFNKE